MKLTKKKTWETTTAIDDGWRLRFPAVDDHVIRKPQQSLRFAVLCFKQLIPSTLWDQPTTYLAGISPCSIGNPSTQSGSIFHPQWQIASPGAKLPGRFSSQGAERWKEDSIGASSAKPTLTLDASAPGANFFVVKIYKYYIYTQHFLSKNVICQVPC